MNRNDILLALEEAFLTAEAFYGKEIPRPNEIIFKRNGTTAGWSNYSTRKMMFQLDLSESVGKEYIETVQHEAAHWVTDHIYGLQFRMAQTRFGLKKQYIAHGKHWKYVMRYVYNLSPDRCHSYDVSVTKTKRQVRHTYGCGCGKTFNVSTTKHNRIQSGRNYYCVACKGKIAYKVAENKQTEIQKIMSQLKQLGVSV